MAVGNFNPAMVAIFVAIGLGVGLSLKFLANVAPKSSVDTPDASPSKGIDAIDVEEATEETESYLLKNITSEAPVNAVEGYATSTINTINITTNVPTNILDEEDIDEILKSTTINPSSSPSNEESSPVIKLTSEPTKEESSSVIELIQTIWPSNDNQEHNIPLSCSLSSDGKRFAASGITNNVVDIYEFSSTVLSHVKNSTIVSEDYDGENALLFGSIVSMSGSGNIVAVGSRYMKNASSIVQIYSYDAQSLSWEQVGITLSSPILLYHATHLSLSLSQNGKNLVIGNTNSNAFGPKTGQVEVYKYSEPTNSWTLNGVFGSPADDIYGRGRATSLYDYNGTLVFAVASPSSGDNYAGSVALFEYNDTYSTWKTLGKPFVGNQPYSYNGISLSLSTNPYTNLLLVAIGSKYYSKQKADDSAGPSVQDQFRIYEYPNNDQIIRSVKTPWIQIGTSLHNSNNQIPNQENALSINGHCIVLSSPYHSTKNQTNIGYITIQCLGENQQWKQLSTNDDNSFLIGDEDDCFFGYHVSLSDIVDGSSVLLVSNKFDKIFVYRVNYKNDEKNGVIENTDEKYEVIENTRDRNERLRKNRKQK